MNNTKSPDSHPQKPVKEEPIRFVSSMAAENSARIRLTMAVITALYVKSGRTFRPCTVKTKTKKPAQKDENGRVNKRERT
jgi:hypothetical protein